MNAHPFRTGLSSLLLASLLSACGGGGGGEAAAPEVAQPPPTSGIEGTGRRIASMGAITGFGSIFVNGIEYSTDRASIQVDGRSVTQGALALGDVVTVVGALNADGKTAAAETVTFTAPLVGPVQAIDPANATLTVLGQPVLIDGTTRFAQDISPASLQGLAIGMELQISGFRDSRGVLAARSVARRGSGQSLAATGVAANVDSAAQRVVIGALTVSYAGAALDGFGGRLPQSGDFLRVEANSLGGGSILQATRVALVDRRLPAQTGNTGHLQGWVTRFSSITDFEVDGIRITTDANTKHNSLEPAGFGGLRLDRFVNVIGVLLADGRLLATNIITNNLATINATITRITPFEIEYAGGRTCATDATTFTVDGRSASWSALQPGDVASFQQSFGANEPLRCSFATANRAARGPIEALDVRRGRLTVLGQNVTVTGETLIGAVTGSRSIDSLASFVPGDIVELSGYRNSSGVLVATRIAPAAVGASRQVSGQVGSLDTVARRFSIGALEVQYGSATLLGLPAGGLQSGQRVIARGSGGAGGVLIAAELEYDAPVPRGTSVAAAHVIGPITRFASLADFDIEGRNILTAPGNNSVAGPGPTCGEERLGLDSFVTSITAVQPVAAVPNFARVLTYYGNYGRPFGGDALLIEGRIDTLDGVARVLTVGGAEVALQAVTEVRQASASGGCPTPLPFASLQAGDTVRVLGLGGPGMQVLVASQVERQEPSVAAARFSASGQITAISATEFTVADVRARFASSTVVDNCLGSVLTVGEFVQLVQRDRSRPGAIVAVTTRGRASPGAPALQVVDTINSCLETGEKTGAIRAQVVAVDAAARRVDVLGMAITLDPGVTLPATGEWVELAVRWRPLRNRIDAASVQPISAGTTGVAVIRVAPDSRAAPRVTLLGQSVGTDAGTQFLGGGSAISAAAFFEQDWDEYEFEVERDAGGQLRARRIDASLSF